MTGLPLPPSTSSLTRHKPLKRTNASLAPSQLKRTGGTLSKRRPISEASPAQRLKCQGAACVVCRQGPCDPAHLIDRSLVSDIGGDPRAVIPLCKGLDGCHRKYDDGGLSILEYLEPHHRTELAFAVERFGLAATYRRVTNERNIA